MQAAMIPIQKVLHFRLEANTTLCVEVSPSHDKDETFLPSYTTGNALQWRHRVRLDPLKQNGASFWLAIGIPGIAGAIWGFWGTCYQSWVGVSVLSTFRKCLNALHDCHPGAASSLELAAAGWELTYWQIVCTVCTAKLQHETPPPLMIHQINPLNMQHQ